MIDVLSTAREARCNSKGENARYAHKTPTQSEEFKGIPRAI